MLSRLMCLFNTRRTKDTHHLSGPPLQIRTKCIGPVRDLFILGLAVWFKVSISIVFEVRFRANLVI